MRRRQRRNAGIQPSRLRWWPALLAWTLWALAMLGLAATSWFDHLLRRAGRSELVVLDAALAPHVLASVSAVTVGALLISRRPRHPVGWLLLAFGLLAVPSPGAADGYAAYGLLARPGALPAANFAGMVAAALFAPGPAWFGIGLVLLLTPTGSLPSPRWRWWVWVSGTASAVFVLSRVLGHGPRSYDPALEAFQRRSPYAARALASPLLVAGNVALAVMGLALVVALGSLLVRFRRSRGVERQQLRWLVWVGALMPVVLAAAAAGALAGQSVVSKWAVGAWLALVPVAIGAAIARYRLYDVDRIVSRTLAYGLLTLMLGGGYVGMVVGLGQLLGRSSSLAVAGATLAVAAVFHPARRRIQDLVDRRFNRRRYDAARTIEAFAARLRQQVDIDALTAQLLAVVDKTVQPAMVLLWLRPVANQTSAPLAAPRPATNLKDRIPMQHRTGESTRG